MKTFNEQVEAQTLICNIQAMRNKIGLPTVTFEFLWNKTVKELRQDQEYFIVAYNKELQKSNL